MLNSDRRMIKTSAPGKLMLFGEHAVLYGKTCLVAAVTPRAHVSLLPRTDTHVIVESELGRYECELGDVVVQEPFTFVNAAIKQVSPDHGFELRVRCEFPADVGLGSSAAVTVAVVAALMIHKGGGRPDVDDVFRQSLEIVRTVQGTGSGADLAASCFGGVLQLEAGGHNLRRLNCLPAIVAVYSGAKEKTTIVINKVRDALEREPDRFASIFDRVGEVVNRAVTALEDDDLELVGRLMADNQQLMVEMGVSNDALDSIIRRLCEDEGVYGAKISGSGLGDCVWGLGHIVDGAGVDILELSCDKDGLLFD